jgi:hypothetical protein
VKVAVMLFVFMATAAVTAAEADSTHGRVRSIVFRFQPVTIGEKRAFHVEVQFRALGAVTAIAVPTRWGGAPHLESQTQNLKVVTPGATLEGGADPGEKK